MANTAIIIRPDGLPADRWPREGLGDATAAPTPSAGPTFATVAMWTVVGLGIIGIGYLLVKGPGELEENPTGAKRRPRKSLIQKGRNVEFLMKEGGSHRCQGSMMHDPSGRYWPRTSVLCGPLSANARRAMKEDITAEARHYLNRDPRMARVDTPPRSIKGWTYLGEVEEIRYTRTGNRSPGRYFHEFSKGTALATLVKGKGRARLYRLGRWYRLDLPSNAILDTRGFVWP